MNKDATARRAHFRGEFIFMMLIFLDIFNRTFELRMNGGGINQALPLAISLANPRHKIGPK